MPVVSVRVNANDLAFLRRHRIAISQAGRQAIADFVRRLERKAARDRLDAVATRPSQPAERTIRQLRDG